MRQRDPVGASLVAFQEEQMSTDPQVQTARGELPVAQLGHTLMHEHIFNTSAEIEFSGLDRYWDEEREVARAVAKLDELKGLGIDTLVDCTAPGLGRNIRAIAKVAERTPLNVVVATGLYAPQALPYYFAFRGPGTPIPIDDPMDALFAREIEQGIDGTGIKPGFIKAALESPDPESQLARPTAAAARVSAATGTPVQIHTDVFQSTGLTVIEIFQRYGADFSQLVIGHSGDSNDLDYLARLFDSGAFVGFDRFGVDFYNSPENRIETLLAVIERGYIDQIVLSHDACSFNDLAPDADSQAGLAAALPDYRYTFLSTEVLPKLKERGITDAQLDTMLVANPARFFGGA
jgi:phosphotriesterase-related protein